MVFELFERGNGFLDISLCKMVHAQMISRIGRVGIQVRGFANQGVRLEEQPHVKVSARQPEQRIFIGHVPFEPLFVLKNFRFQVRHCRPPYFCEIIAC